MAYPKNYENISKRLFLQTDLKDSACILFVPEDGYHNIPKDYPEGYIPTLKNHAKTAYDTLYIPAEDVGVNWGDEFKHATMDHLYQINTFLQKNANKNIISVCDAGISRSGFITFLLDIKNNNLKYVTTYETKGEIIFTCENRPFNKTYLANSELTHHLLESNILTTIEKQKLKTIIKPLK